MQNLKGWVGQGSPLHGSYLSRDATVPPCSTQLGFPTHLLSPCIPKGWARPRGTQKNALQTLQISNCFLSHFPNLKETRSNRSIDGFREDKECFNINISGQGFDTHEATKNYCNQTLSLSLQVYITWSCKILKACTLFIFLKQISKKMEG